MWQRRLSALYPKTAQVTVHSFRHRTSSLLLTNSTTTTPHYASTKRCLFPLCPTAIAVARRSYSSAQNTADNAQDRKQDNENDNEKRRQRRQQRSRKGEYNPVFSLIKQVLLFSPPLVLVAWWVYKTWNPYPREARFHLRSAILADRYKNDPRTAVPHYKMAIAACVANDYLPADCLAVMGIKVLLAEALERLGDRQSLRDAALLYADLSALYSRHNDTRKCVSMAVRCGQLLQSGLNMPNLVEPFYKFALYTMLQRPDARLPKLVLSLDPENENRKLLSVKLTGQKLAQEQVPISDVQEVTKMLTVDSKLLASWVSARDLGATLFSLGGLMADRGQHQEALALYFQALAAIDHDSSDESQGVPSLLCQRATVFNAIAVGMNHIGRGDLALTWASKSLSFAQHSQRLEDQQREADRVKDESSTLRRLSRAIGSAISGASSRAALENYTPTDKDHDKSEDGNSTPSNTDFVQDVENTKLVVDSASSQTNDINFPVRKDKGTTNDENEDSLIETPTSYVHGEQMKVQHECDECEIVTLVNFAEILQDVRNKQQQKQGEEKGTSQSNEQKEKADIDTSKKNQLTVEKIEPDFSILNRYSSLSPQQLLDIALKRCNDIQWESGTTIIQKSMKDMKDKEDSKSVSQHRRWFG